MKISIVEKKKFKNNNFAKVLFSDKIPENRMLLSGGLVTLEIKIPEKKKINFRQATIIARKIVAFAKINRIKKLALDWNIVKSLKLGEEQLIAETFGINFEMANYEFVSFKTAPKEGWNFVEEIAVVVDGKNNLKKSLEKGQLIGQHVNMCRELANTPGSNMTPQILVAEIKKAIKNTGIKMKVLDEKKMKKLGMNAVLAVAQGSKEKPRFIVLEYGNSNKEKPIVLIGKGVTFDSGGLNIKTYMTGMNMDMSGGAAVAHTIILAAKLKLKKKIVAIIPAVESMPSGESLRPCDVIKSMSGKTIEVQDTDAEGRIILADANTFAERLNPRLVVDVATLTGAASVALGERASAILTKDEKFSDLLRKLGEESGDYVWPLPLWDEYEEEIKGANGDVCNIRNRAETREGGTILGAMFIYQFAKKFPIWAHIDIAPRMTAVYDEFLTQGAAGTPVRLLIKLLEKF